MTRRLLELYDYLVLYLGLFWLGIQCLGWTLVAPSVQAAMGRE